MDDVAMAGREVCRVLNELRSLFRPECELTFIMRLPGNDDADMLVTNDDLDELTKLIKRRKSESRGDW